MTDEPIDSYRKLETPDVINRDNDLLHPLAGCIGHVDEVNGRSATEIPEFIPTQHELLELVKYWTKVALGIEFLWFCYESPGSSDIRLRPFAYRRINRIAKCLGDAVVGRAFTDAREEFAKTVDARAWRIFRHGTPEEQAAFRNEALNV
jgi:hypothetical protein